MAQSAVRGIVAAICTGAAALAQQQLVPLAVQRATFAAADTAAFAELKNGARLGPGSRVRTAEGGWARLASGAPGTTEVVVRGNLAVLDEHPPDGVGVGLASGTLFAFAEKGAVQVRFAGGELTARAARLAVATEPTDGVRVTVDFGTARIVVAGGRACDVAAGQTVKISGTGAVRTVSGPTETHAVAAARADLAALRAAQADRLAPADAKEAREAKEVLPPVAAAPGSAVETGTVGAGPLLPFDPAAAPQENEPSAKARKKAALLKAPNPANLSPPVNSPERP